MAHIKVTMQINDYPSDDDVTKVFSIATHFIRETLQPIDFPSSNCDALTAAVFCTNPSKAESIKIKRKDFARMISETITDALCKKDTIMGYKRN